MDFREKKPSCEELRQIDMVSFLATLGYEPARIRNNDYWYLSPLREERTASFKVNRKLNRWYDHGLGKGGNLIDFAILYNNCTVGEFLQAMDKNSSFHKADVRNSTVKLEEEDRRIIGIKESSLCSFSLCRYLDQRRIPLEIAKQFCREVTYTVSGKKYFAIGFLNNSGGYELRNPYFKGSASPKDITIIGNYKADISVFEGFFDFLSFMALQQSQQVPLTNFLILNSISFFEKARAFMERHEKINLYLDQDKTGQNCTQYALGISKKYIDKSCLYKHYKDLNDWTMNIGKQQNVESGKRED